MGGIREKFDLSGKVAIVTGSSKGIGASIVRGLAEFGASVIISSRRQEAIDVVEREYKMLGLNVKAISCHVGDSNQCVELIAETIKQFGRLDILVNNAGTNPYYGAIEDMTEAVYEKTLEINLNAARRLSNLALPHMKSAGGGSIIHVSSIEGLHPSAMMSAYNISKSGLIMLGQNQAVEWAKHKIRVNMICPGLVRTKLSAALFADEQIEKKIINKIPLKRAATPDEMAGLACFLASDAASYCTGSVIVNDGGILLAPLF